MHPARVGDGFTPNYDGDVDNNHHHHNRDPSNHHRKFSGVALRITLLFVIVGITSFFLFRSRHSSKFIWKSFSYPHPDHSKSFPTPSCEDHDAQNISPTSSFHQYTSPQNMSLPAKEAENKELEKTLRKAVMNDNRTVIITTLNAAWTGPNSTLDLFLEGFRIGNGTADLLKHVVVGAFDQVAYNRCLAAGLHCFAIITAGVDFSGEEVFMQRDYLKMMWRRLDVLITVLELGFDFVFTDADVVWLRIPFERFYPDGEIQIACDHYGSTYTDVNNGANGGFVYVKSNNRTIRFYKYWYAGRVYFPGKHDQDVFNMIKYNPIISEIGLELRFLDTAFFSGFCEPSRDLDEVITMHATCCVGQKDKMNALKMVIDDWKRYVSTPPDQRDSFVRSWTNPKPCII